MPWADDWRCLRHLPLTRGIAAALDHLDSVNLCACWTAGRTHETAAAA